MRRFLMAIAALVVAATLSTATSAFAQLGGGTLSGTLTDEQGGVLPGVTVTISGSDRTTDAVSDRGRQIPLPESRARPVQGEPRAPRLRDHDTG